MSDVEQNCLLPSTVQISLVWNARDEDFVDDEKVRKMAEVIHLLSFLCTTNV